MDIVKQAVSEIIGVSIGSDFDMISEMEQFLISQDMGDLVIDDEEVLIEMCSIFSVAERPIADILTSEVYRHLRARDVDDAVDTKERVGHVIVGAAGTGYELMTLGIVDKINKTFPSIIAEINQAEKCYIDIKCSRSMRKLMKISSVKRLVGDVKDLSFALLILPPYGMAFTSICRSIIEDKTLVITGKIGLKIKHLTIFDLINAFQDQEFIDRAVKIANGEK